MRKKNTKKLKIVEISIFVTIVLFVFAITAIYNEKTVKTNTELLSNKKIGWGIKRNDNHEQPDVGSENKNVLEQYNGIALGNNEKKYIYLTFDEGYEAGYTSKILEILKNNQVKATFFITAHYVNTQEELVKQMIEEGHIVGNHTVNHKSMPDLSEEINTYDIFCHFCYPLFSKIQRQACLTRYPCCPRTLRCMHSLWIPWICISAVCQSRLSLFIIYL